MAKEANHANHKNAVNSTHFHCNILLNVLHPCADRNGTGQKKETDNECQEVEVMTLEELKAKIEQFLKLNTELREIGLCDIIHDTSRGFLHSAHMELCNIVAKHALEYTLEAFDSKDFPWKISVPELKMFAIMTDEQARELGVLECTKMDMEQATESRS